MQSSNSFGITVALPTCNGARHLAETIYSILTQTSDISFILCDDRSDDDTLAIARNLAGDRLRIEVNSERLGLAGNWNRCLSLAETPLVAIVHQDDVLRPNHLESHRKAFLLDDGIGLIASATSTIDELGREVPQSVVDRGGLGATDRLYSSAEAIKALAPYNPLRCSAVTIVRSAFETLGGFDPSYRYVVDWEYWLRIVARYKLAWLAEPSVEVRWHLESETHRFASGTLDLDETDRLQTAILEAPSMYWPDARAIRKSANHRLARAFLNRAYVASKAGNSRLARAALRRAIGLQPLILGRIMLDPRLAARLASSLIKA